MRLSVMQPYLFPYIGYFRLIASVDRFVFLDDVNYIKRGWINRNRLVQSGVVRYFTIPLLNQSQFRKINDIDVVPRNVWQRSMRESIRQSYGKSPHYDAVIELFDEATASGGIAEIAKCSIEVTSRYLDLECDFVRSAAIYGNTHVTGQDRILDICSKEGADIYVNLPGGKSLYDSSKFAANGVELRFIDETLPAYSRGSCGPVEGLSILDLLMFQPPAAARSLLLR